jgi:hypothetical protein
MGWVIKLSNPHGTFESTRNAIGLFYRSAPGMTEDSLSAIITTQYGCWFNPDPPSNLIFLLTISKLIFLSNRCILSSLVNNPRSSIDNHGYSFDQFLSPHLFDYLIEERIGIYKWWTALFTNGRSYRITSVFLEQKSVLSGSGIAISFLTLDIDF